MIMTDEDLEQMGLEELNTLKKKVEKAIGSYEARQKKAALEAIARTASEHGFSLDELVGGQKKIKVPAPAKYRHPEKPEFTWSGRGRQPAWFKELIAEGQNPENLEIS